MMDLSIVNEMIVIKTHKSVNIKYIEKCKICEHTHVFKERLYEKLNFETMLGK